MLEVRAPPPPLLTRANSACSRRCTRADVGLACNFSFRAQRVLEVFEDPVLKVLAACSEGAAAAAAREGAGASRDAVGGYRSRGGLGGVGAWARGAPRDRLRAALDEHAQVCGAM